MDKQAQMHFAGVMVRRIEQYIEYHPNKSRDMIGMKRETDGDFLWINEDWSKKPHCNTCGQEMIEGTIVNPGGHSGYPYWFCTTKACCSAVLSRMQKEIEKYYESGGRNTYMDTAKNAMNIPRAYWDKNLKNLKWRHKDKAGEFMKNHESMLITGHSGTGKTHLAVGLLIEHGLKMSHKCRFVPIHSLFHLMHEHAKGDSGCGKLVNEMNSLEMLVIDDLGAIKTSDFRYEVLYSIIIGRDYENRQTIITTNLTLSEITQQYDERFASRLASYRHVRMSGDDRRKK